MIYFKGMAAFVMVVLVLGWSASAAIPEPDLIYFGEIQVNGTPQTSVDDTIVELRRGGLKIAESGIQNLGPSAEYYVLRIGVEAGTGGGPSHGVAQLGESLTLALVSVSQAVDLAVATVTLGSRGRVTRQDLDTATAGDFDGDGVPDYLDNCHLPNGGQTDTNGNGIGDDCEGLVNPGLMYQVIGDVDNPADPATGKGDVSYEFQMTDIEVTNSDYLEFLNAVAASDPSALYNDAMATDPRGGIVRAGVDGGYSYQLKPNMANKPVNFVSWLDAARYTNWLENGMLTGVPGAASTEAGAFDLSVADPGTNAVPDPAAEYSLPTEDEWYKAAYYDPTRGGSEYWTYPIQIDVPPIPATATAIGDVSNPGVEVANHLSAATWNAQMGNVTTGGDTGSSSFYGTADQGGNVREWLANDVETTPEGPKRVARGGSYATDHLSLTSTADSPDREEVLAAHDSEEPDLGFRVLFIPEPSMWILLAAGVSLLGVLSGGRDKRRAELSGRDVRR